VRSIFLLGALPAALVLACTGQGNYLCERDEQCVASGVQGTCEASGFCSFPDDSCRSGSRYGDYAPAGIGGRCVPAADELDASLPSDAPQGEPDAHTAEPDAHVAEPDAHVAPPDAATPLPDGGSPEIIVTFGETGGATHTNVTTDTWIDSMNPSFGNGASAELRTDGAPLRLALLRFDLSALPPGTQVVHAELVVTTTAAGALTQGSTQIFQLLEPWTEGSGNGAADVANWTQRTAAAAWTTAGAASPGSRATAVASEFVPSANDTSYTVGLPASLVQGWIDAPASNDGVIFVNRNAADRSVLLVSSEGAAAAKRPLLRLRVKLP
jgi:hypothetical protein